MLSGKLHYLGIPERLRVCTLNRLETRTVRMSCRDIGGLRIVTALETGKRKAVSRLKLFTYFKNLASLGIELMDFIVLDYVQVAKILFRYVRYVLTGSMVSTHVH